MSDTPLFWVGSAQSDLRAFPKRARRLAGYQLRRVQAGLTPSDWKPMRTVGPGVNEVRIRTGLEHRVLYVVHRGDAVYVLHAFEKTHPEDEACGYRARKATTGRGPTDPQQTRIMTNGCQGEEV